MPLFEEVSTDGLSPDFTPCKIQFVHPQVASSSNTNFVTVQKVSPRQLKTRTGCTQCKKRKVKCDEGLPSCRRCIARKETCVRPEHTSKWHEKTISFEKVQQSPKEVSIIKSDDAILEYWFEHGCRVFTMEPVASNPFSYPLLESLSISQSLFHLVRSLSLADQADYQMSKLAQSLDERGLAIVALRQEIKERSVPCGLLLLSTLFLGMSSSWMNGNPSDFGHEHLSAVSAMINKAFAYRIGPPDELYYLAIGVYIYWDMACSFLVPFNEATPLREEVFQLAHDLTTKKSPHPVTGVATQLIYILGKIGRYQRQVLDTKKRNLDLENLLEAQLTDWKTPSASRELKTIAECYRMTGFLMLYSAKGDKLYDDRIVWYAEMIVDMLDQFPITSPRLNFQGLMLMIAGSEIDDPKRRKIVLDRFRALYEAKKLQIILYSEQLVEEVWVLRDQGRKRCWLSVMLNHGWNIMLA